VRVINLTRCVVVCAVIPAVLLACAGPQPSGNVKPGRGRAVEIVANDSFFEPETVDLRAGEEVTFEIVNDGDMPHEFSIEKLGISTGTIPPGEAKTVTFNVAQGRIEFACVIHGGMKAPLVTGERRGSG
jgi:plastocyanin